MFSKSKLTNNKFRLIFFFSLIIFSNFSAKLFSQELEKNSKAEQKNKIYIAHIALGNGIDTTTIKDSKVKAAMNLVAILSEKFELIPDNIVMEKSNELVKPYTAFDVAKATKADRILIIKVEQLENILRAEINSVNPQNPEKVTNSEGFAFINYFENTTNKPVYDPSLLAALQRAFAISENDSLMFLEKEDVFSVIPAPNLVISGIQFNNNSELEKWDVFDNTIVKSYEFCEIIFKEIKKNNKWIIFDIDSRDAVYKIFNLHLIENNVKPSSNEFAALKKFGISFYIDGTINRNKEGIEIILSLNKIDDNLETKTIKSASAKVTTNDLVIIKDAVKKIANKLIMED
jgi:hypothetical protein